MDDQIYKEVYFDQYCKTCEHADLKDTDKPCCECLDNPTNLYSHKPVKYEEKRNSKRFSKK